MTIPFLCWKVAINAIINRTFFFPPRVEIKKNNCFFLPHLHILKRIKTRKEMWDSQRYLSIKGGIVSQLWQCCRLWKPLPSRLESDGSASSKLRLELVSLPRAAAPALNPTKVPGIQHASSLTLLTGNRMGHQHQDKGVDRDVLCIRVSARWKNIAEGQKGTGCPVPPPPPSPKRKQEWQKARGKSVSSGHNLRLQTVSRKL